MNLKLSKAVVQAHARLFLIEVQKLLGRPCTLTQVMEGMYCVRCEGGPLLYYHPEGVGERRRMAPEEPGIHLAGSDWLENREKVSNRLRAMFGMAERLYARQTQVRRVDRATAISFQENHHLQVALPGKYRYGLYDGEQLVSLAVFSGGRKMRERPEGYRSYELLRFCNRGPMVVVGGLSKLIGHFEREHHPGDLMTYVDADWSDGSKFIKLGFGLVGHHPEHPSVKLVKQFQPSQHAEPGKTN